MLFCVRIQNRPLTKKFYYSTTALLFVCSYFSEGLSNHPIKSCCQSLFAALLCLLFKCLQMTFIDFEYWIEHYQDRTELQIWAVSFDERHHVKEDEQVKLCLTIAYQPVGCSVAISSWSTPLSSAQSAHGLAANRALDLSTAEELPATSRYAFGRSAALVPFEAALGPRSF